MNEQIQSILNENGTKTSKIQKLLALGLTRRQVADLVAGGNYGFVQNVYKRMMQSLTNTPSTATSGWRLKPTTAHATALHASLPQQVSAYR